MYEFPPVLISYMKMSEEDKRSYAAQPHVKKYEKCEDRTILMLLCMYTPEILNNGG